MPVENDQIPQFVPITLQGTDVLMAQDLAYATISDAQKLDLYLPQGSGPFPLIMYVHGGAFKFGDKRENEATSAFHSLLAAGYAIASINYRLSGEAKFPALIHDVKAAVRWLRANATKCRIAPQCIGAWGASAGGHLVCLLGTSNDVAKLEGAELGNSEQSSRVQAVVAWYPPTDFLQMDAQLVQNPLCGSKAATHNDADSPESELIGAPIQTVPESVQTANPVTYVNNLVPPFLLEHGTADCVVPAQQSQVLYDTLLPILGPKHVELVYLEGARHADRMFPQVENMQRVRQFFDEHIRE